MLHDIIDNRELKLIDELARRSLRAKRPGSRLATFFFPA
jgi:hypothetical protein